MNSKSTLLQILPPTEAAFEEQVKQAAYATIIDKSAHIAKPQLPSYTEYGWKIDKFPIPITSSAPPWPAKMDKSFLANVKRAAPKIVHVVKMECLATLHASIAWDHRHACITGYLNLLQSPVMNRLYIGLFVGPIW